MPHARDQSVGCPIVTRPVSDSLKDHPGSQDVVRTAPWHRPAVVYRTSKEDLSIFANSYNCSGRWNDIRMAPWRLGYKMPSDTFRDGEEEHQRCVRRKFDSSAVAPQNHVPFYACLGSVKEYEEYVAFVKAKEVGSAHHFPDAVNTAPSFASGDGDVGVSYYVRVEAEVATSRETDGISDDVDNVYLSSNLPGPELGIGDAMKLLLPVQEQLDTTVSKSKNATCRELHDYTSRLDLAMQQRLAAIVSASKAARFRKQSEMHRMKKVAPDRDRWRSPDEQTQNMCHITDNMRASVMQWARKKERLSPVRNLNILRRTGVSAQPAFLERAHTRSLRVLNLMKNDALRHDYWQLFLDIPTTTWEEHEAKQLKTSKDMASVIVHLVYKHAGEIVELDVRDCIWTLEAAPPGSASADTPDELYCKQNKNTVDRADPEFGWPGVLKELSLFTFKEIEKIKQLRCQIRTKDLFPDWTKQVTRITCPCMDPDCGYEWARDGMVMTLGELFMVLGKKHTASQIYAFYRTLRIVAVKQICSSHAARTT